MRFFVLNKRSKYNNIRTEIDGIKFQSEKEADFYAQLKLRQKAGDIDFFLRQVPFDLPGGIKYFADFMVFEKDGSVHFIDIKGVRTRVFINKKKQVEALYPVKIEER